MRIYENGSIIVTIQMKLAKCRSEDILMVNVKAFFKYNGHKSLTLKVWWLAGWYRIRIRFRSGKHLEESWGIKGRETTDRLEEEQKAFALLAAEYVNRSCRRTPWESLCLVRALTARRLLAQKHIPCTIYLGVGKDENGKMVAHAWLRAGEFYITGGDGSGYACVARFAVADSEEQLK